MCKCFLQGPRWGAILECFEGIQWFWTQLTWSVLLWAWRTTFSFPREACSGHGSGFCWSIYLCGPLSSPLWGDSSGVVSNGPYKFSGGSDSHSSLPSSLPFAQRKLSFLHLWDQLSENTVGFLHLQNHSWSATPKTPSSKLDPLLTSCSGRWARSWHFPQLYLSRKPLLLIIRTGIIGSMFKHSQGM